MEWKTVKLGDITDLVIDYRGKTPLKLGGEWANSGYRALSAKNIKTGQIVQEESIRYVDEVLYKKWMKDEVQKGDILITSEAPFGQIFYWDSDEKIVLSQRLFDVRINNENDSRYVYYYMTTPNFQAELDGRSTGTTVVGLRQPELLKCGLALPPLSEQKRIATILSSLDAKIENNNRINANLEAQAQALYKSWFVDFEPWGGTMPEDWKEGTLGDIVTVKRGGSPRPIQDYLSDKGYRWLKISDATAEASPFISHIVEHIKEEGLSKTVFIKQGSLVLSNSATPGLPKFVDLDTCIHDGWLYFPQSYFSNEYLYLLFQRERSYLLSQGNGSVFTNLKTDIVKNLSVTIPSEDVLNSFQQIVGGVFMEILNNQRESCRLAALRDTLLPKLMKGEIAL